MKISIPFLSAFFALLFCGFGHAQVPQLINYQGRVVVGTTNFNGSGQFEFALVNTNGSTTYWSNDGTSTAGSQPTNYVTLTVTGGLYSVLLGDSTLANMTPIPATVFNNSDVRLRVWFNDGTDGFQLLSPDQRIAAVGYAMVAATVPNGSITAAQIATNTITSTQIANGAIGSNQIATGAVGSTQLATNIVSSGELTAEYLSTLGTISLPPTTNSTIGVLDLGGSPFLQAYGVGNTFLGSNAGNFSMTGGTNTGIGQSALFSNTTGSLNTAVGQTALEKNNTGTANSAFGASALFFNTTGINNTATGFQALYNNTSATNNTADGVGALATNTTGSDNTAVGFTALEYNTFGTYNAASGYEALQYNATGSFNTASGSSALYKNTAGSYNVATGPNALYYNYNGSYNVAIGYNALYSNFLGTNNIGIGYNAGAGITNAGSYNIDIGNPGTNTDSNIIRLGQNGNQTNTYIAGIYGTSISATNSSPVFINSSGQLGTVTTPAYGYMPTGGIVAYATTNAPSGYLSCNGAPESIVTYPTLFSVIGYTYGGSGTNFDVPTLTNAPTGIYIIKY